MRKLLIPVLALAAPAAAQDTPLSLSLICVGGGSANKPTGDTVSAWSSDGDSATANIRSMRSVGFEDQVSLKIDGESGELRMPRTMLPPLRGGKDGWFKLKNIKVTDGEITASVSVNPINNPKLRLDRYTGSISLSGKAGDFTGRCQRFDPATAEKAF